jgi:methylated-DNA-protein-cysteine methyltransferase-like protein
VTPAGSGSAASGPEGEPFDEAVIRVLADTEPGDVVTYGEVAAEAGRPGAARAVGNLLSRLDGVPWWRVVTASGRLVPHAAERQAALLEGEGVRCRNGRVALPPRR